MDKIEDEKPAKSEAKARTLWDVLDDLEGSIDGPEDWSENLDAYIYGSIKCKTCAVVRRVCIVGFLSSYT